MGPSSSRFPRGWILTTRADKGDNRGGLKLVESKDGWILLARSNLASTKMRGSKTLLGVALLIMMIAGLTVGSSAFAASSSQAGLIAFTRGEGRAQEIVVYDTTTGVERVFTDNDVWDGLPALSPSGRWLAFVRAIPNRGVLKKPDFTLNEADEIIVVDPKNGNIICIGKSDHAEPYELGHCTEYWPDLPPLAGVTNLCWTEDETAILFEALCSITNDLILRMDVPSGELHILCLGNDLRFLGGDRFLIWRHEYTAEGGYERWHVIDPWGKTTACPLDACKQGQTRSFTAQ